MLRFPNVFGTENSDEDSVEDNINPIPMKLQLSCNKENINTKKKSMTKNDSDTESESDSVFLRILKKQKKNIKDNDNVANILADLNNVQEKEKVSDTYIYNNHTSKVYCIKTVTDPLNETQSKNNYDACIRNTQNHSQDISYNIASSASDVDGDFSDSER